MKKSRVFFSCSILVLTVVSAIATKASRKFLSPSTVYYIPSLLLITPLEVGCGSTGLITETGYNPFRFGAVGNLYTIYYFSLGVYIPVNTTYF